MRSDALEGATRTPERRGQSSSAYRSVQHRHTGTFVSLREDSLTLAIISPVSLRKDPCQVPYFAATSSSIAAVLNFVHFGKRNGSRGCKYVQPPKHHVGGRERTSCCNVHSTCRLFLVLVVSQKERARSSLVGSFSHARAVSVPRCGVEQCRAPHPCITIVCNAAEARPCGAMTDVEKLRADSRAL